MSNRHITDVVGNQPAQIYTDHIQTCGRVLTRQSLPLFIEEWLRETRNYEFEEHTYTIISRDKLNDYVLRKIDNKWNVITEADYTELNKRFFDKGRYLSLYGTEDFAHSLITSEYLYRTMTDNNQFDYTAIVCGYLKSIEQLMYKLVLCNMPCSVIYENKLSGEQNRVW